MDAKEQLRRYLEQRREMGERELILDGMSVEDVMRILGASSVGAKDSGSAPRRSEEPREPSTTTSARVDDMPADSPDWRAVLRAAGNEPSRAPTLSRPGASDAPPPQPPAPPPRPDDLDDADAPEDAVGGP